MTARQERIEELRRHIPKMEWIKDNVSSASYTMFRDALDEKCRELEQLVKEETIYQQGFEDGVKRTVGIMATLRRSE